MVVKGLILVKELEHNESVSENLVSEKSLSFGFGEFFLGKKVSVLVSENLVLEQKVSVA